MFVLNNKTHKVHKDTGKCSPYKGKKSQQTVSRKDLMADVLGKTFKATTLNMLTELKEGWRRSRKQCVEILNGKKGSKRNFKKRSEQKEILEPEVK